MKKPKSVKQILSSQGTELQQLVKQSKRLKTLNRRISKLLPTALSQHCTAAGIEQNTLILVVDSPAWASKLRFQSPAIIKGLKEFHIKSVALKIQPPQSQPTQPSRPAPKMSKNTSELINDLADATEEPKLKAALRRLSKHAQN